MTSVSLVAYSDYDPCPRVEISLSGMGASAALTLYRDCGGQTEIVRGAKAKTVSGSTVITDYAAPFADVITYRAVVTGQAQATAQVVLRSTSTWADTAWIQDPFDPQSAIEVPMALGTFASFSFDGDVQTWRTTSSRSPLAIGGTRNIRGSMPIGIYSQNEREHARVEAILTKPVFALRSIPPIPLPRLTYLSATSLQMAPFLESEEYFATWSGTFDSVRAPAASIVRPVHTWGEVLESYPTWGDLLATKSSWLEVLRDPRP